MHNNSAILNVQKIMCAKICFLSLCASKERREPKTSGWCCLHAYVTEQSLIQAVRRHNRRYCASTPAEEVFNTHARPLSGALVLKIHDNIFSITQRVTTKETYIQKVTLCIQPSSVVFVYL